MFRFTIRDVLWLTAVVAFAIFWFLERDGRLGDTERIGKLYRENETLKEEVRRFEMERRKDIIRALKTMDEIGEGLQLRGVGE